MRIQNTFCAVSAFALGNWLILTLNAVADVIPNGLGTTVDSFTCTAICNITGGSPQSHNLFHSFAEFSVPVSGTAIFQHSSTIENLIIRVTGSSPSLIDGTLRTLTTDTVDLGNAALFLINPSGVIFGPTATLDIGGSLIVSTAEQLQFADGVAFSATSPAPLLSISTPIGLQFGANPGSITVQGPGNQSFLDTSNYPDLSARPDGLKVQSGRTLALVGGDLFLPGGNLTALEGRIELGAVGPTAVVNLTNDGSLWSLDYSNTSSFNDIQLSQAASVNVSGNQAGASQIQGNNVTFTDGSVVIALTEGVGNGQPITFKANTLSFSGISDEPLPSSNLTPILSGFVAFVFAPDSMGSNVNIDTHRLLMSAGAQGSTATFGLAQAGNLTVNAQEVWIDGATSFGSTGLFTPTVAAGSGGNLTINAGNTGLIRLTNGAQLYTLTVGSGDAGDLTITAGDLELSGFTDRGPTALLSGVEDPFASGHGGQIILDVARLLLTDSAQISSRTLSTDPNNHAGNVIVNATESVTLSGAAEKGRSGLFASNLSLDFRTFGGPIFTSLGSGGTITVNTPQLTLQDGATINVSSFPSGTSPFLMPGDGAAGNLNIVTDILTLDNDAILTANARSGGEGNINIQAEDLTLLRGASRITTDATGTATGGNINLQTNVLLAIENSDITANAVDNFGGRVVVNAQSILGTAFRDSLTAESDITASSALGPAFGGTVEINTTNLDPIQGLVALPTNPNGNDQVAVACDAYAEDNTLIVTGPGGLPENASEVLRGTSIWQDLRLTETPIVEGSIGRVNSVAEGLPTIAAQQPQPLIEAKGVMFNPQGQVVLSAHLPGQNFSGANAHSCLGG